MNRVLIVDDDPEVVLLIQYRLSRAGFEVAEAADGQQALDMLAKEPLPSLVLLDIMMPGLSGLEVLEQIRHDEAIARLPVILLTAKAQEQDISRGFELGADDYITKPFSLRELTLRINAVLSRAGG